MAEQTAAEVTAGEAKVSSAESRSQEAETPPASGQTRRREFILRQMAPGKLADSSLRTEPESSKPEELVEADWDGFDPLLVREAPSGVDELLDGKRRKDTAVLKGLRRVPVLHLGPISDVEAIAMILKSGITGKPRPPMETAKLIERLTKERPDLDSRGKVAKFLGVSKMLVSRYLRLLNAPPEEQAAVDAGRKSMTELVRKKSSKPRKGETKVPPAGDQPTTKSAEDRKQDDELASQTPPADDMFADLGEIFEAKRLLDGVVTLAAKVDTTGKRELLTKLREVAAAIEASLAAEGVARDA